MISLMWHLLYHRLYIYVLNHHIDLILMFMEKFSVHRNCTSSQPNPSSIYRELFSQLTELYLMTNIKFSGEEKQIMKKVQSPVGTDYRLYTCHLLDHILFILEPFYLSFCEKFYR